MIYKCLTTHQKSVVFKVTETFRILHKEDDEEMRSTRSKDEEVSRQEENLLKLFSSSVDSGNTLSIDNVSSILSCIACIILHIVFSVFMCAKYSEISDQIDRTGPHIEHGQASFAFDLETVVLLHLLPGSVYPSRNFNIYGFQTDTILYYINYWQTKAQQEFTKLKYGDPDNHLKSFAAVGVDINFQAGIPSYCDNETIPINSHDLYDCMSSEIAISYVEMIVNRLVNIYTSRNEIYGGNEEDLTNLYHCMQHHIFDRFYYNLFLSMTNKVVESVEKDLPLIDEIGIIICIIAIVIEIINMIAIQMSENNLRYALSLLLMCPAKMVLSNSHILNVLGGNFHNKTLDQTTRGSDFYDGLVEEMPDSVIIITAGGIINSANKATTSLFNKTKEELVGNRIDLIGNLFKEGNPFQKYFDGNIQNISNSDKAANKETNIEMKLSFDKDDSVVHVLMNLVMLPEGIFVSCRDITQQVMYDKLIQDEKLRSDSLLASILPPRLVSRVASGEKNISFAVQTATVVFIDIVSFTPWCGSTPADKVMKTLTLLFKYFDSSTASHSTMTKCKCIGDCYMAAGGIFADVNQPAVHAKDVVEFGLEALDNIVRLNKEINESLQIRVGINTGGPLVAGVLGTEKPTFEILGPTINMAQQMEHHGVPMKVHISRSVYELIYGSNFKIQERGQIEIKNSQVVTYLVSRE
ncbi:Adenylate and Guanylate cyclase catalytic domain containing protein [Tritrichomonas foetus]|uniref:Adenylate and Guanylate cyclase catalytic domain containing protein n=1 Tax=Tritrichomonas foetus TaxID=1144522 RepID=A0A1J4J8P1_9EUKA|nr:Adenylate and Guanylate cyclase catalytic domain containing protein [Tritrichomonas foetus]|eukprot:OHS95554.1 Adenylate and Guanylate cyclase catalytic domain containing protein [Tritrichomonas foetus]